MFEGLEQAEGGERQRTRADEGYPARRGIGCREDGAELEPGELFIVGVVGECLQAGADLVGGGLGVGGQDELGPVELEARLRIGADLAEGR